MLPENVMSGRVESSGAGRDRRAAVDEFEVRFAPRADEARDEHLLDALHVLVPGDPGDGRVGRVHRAGRHARVLGVILPGFLFSEHCSSFVVDAAQAPNSLVPVVSSTPLRLVADGDPVKAALGGFVLDALGREHHLVFVQRQVAFALLVPHDPRHAVLDAGEGDVGLDAVARRVDVQARVWPPGPTRGIPVCWKQKPPIAGT